MLQKKSLWFSNGVYLAETYDKFEGHFPIPVIEKSEVERRKYIEKFKEWDTVIVNLGWSLASLRKDNSKFIYVNCWHRNEYEYPHMWKMYSGEELGVAIESTVGQLSESIILPKCKSSGIFSVVYYNDDYDQGSMRFDWSPFIYKKINYEYEKEIRVILFQIENTKSNINDFFEYENQKGCNVEVELNKLITRIYVDPKSSDKIDLIKSLMQKYGLDIEVSTSSLSEKPVY